MRKLTDRLLVIAIGVIVGLFLVLMVVSNALTRGLSHFVLVL